MELGQDTQQKIMDAFGLNHLGVGTHKIKNQQGLNEQVISLLELWIIELMSHPGPLVIAGGLVRDDHKGVEKYLGLMLLIDYPGYDFAKNASHKAVEIAWPNELIDAMQDLSIFPPEPQRNPLDHWCTLHTYRGFSQCHFTYVNNSRQPKFQKLFEAIVKTVEQIAQVYNNREIDQYITGPHWTG